MNLENHNFDFKNTHEPESFICYILLLDLINKILGISFVMAKVGKLDVRKTANKFIYIIIIIISSSITIGPGHT